MLISLKSLRGVFLTRTRPSFRAGAPAGLLGLIPQTWPPGPVRLAAVLPESLAFQQQLRQNDELVLVNGQEVSVGEYCLGWTGCWGGKKREGLWLIANRRSGGPKILGAQKDLLVRRKHQPKQWSL